MSLHERFEAKVERAGASECWPWLAARTADGYGEIHVDGRNQRAHRVAYATYIGPIPSGLHVLHSCDNPSCCNPAHLFLGTNADNVADRQAKGRVQRHGRGGTSGTANPRAKLTPEKAAEIRSRHAGGESLRSLGRSFGVDHKTIRNIIIGRTWKSGALVSSKGARYG